MISLIVGLGNPGKQYLGTRHNVGFWLTDTLAKQQSLCFSEKKKLYSRMCTYDLHSLDAPPLIVAQPLTYMNASGTALQALASWYKLTPSMIVVVHDDLDLPPGRVQLKLGGGHGGHNGLRDIIRCLGADDFVRLRIGIGHPGSKDKVLSHVLKSPSTDDRVAIDSAIHRALALLPEWQQGNWHRVMQQLHSNVRSQEN